MFCLVFISFNLASADLVFATSSLLSVFSSLVFTTTGGTSTLVFGWSITPGTVGTTGHRLRGIVALFLGLSFLACGLGISFCGVAPLIALFGVSITTTSVAASLVVSGLASVFCTLLCCLRARFGLEALLSTAGAVDVLKSRF
jgi:hypothetical protein